MQFNTLYGKKAAALYTQVLICAKQTKKLRVQGVLERGCENRAVRMRSSVRNQIQRRLKDGSRD